MAWFCVVRFCIEGNNYVALHVCARDKVISLSICPFDQLSVCCWHKNNCQIFKDKLLLYDSIKW